MHILGSESFLLIRCTGEEEIRMRPIKNESSEFIIEILESTQSEPFKFKTCWLCHKPIYLVFMCDKCWQMAPRSVKEAAENALREAAVSGSRTIHQLSPTSYKIGR